MASYLLKKSLRSTSASLLLLLGACMGGGSDNGGVFSSQEVSEDKLRLIGFPPSNMIVGAPYTFEFGITGGSGNYRARYIQNVEGIRDPIQREKFRDELDDSDRNPVELEIQNLDLAKAAFRLTGVPQVTDDLVDDTGFVETSYSYFVEVTDGKDEDVKRFNFTLFPNSVSVNLARSGSLIEGRESVSPTAIANTVLCDEAKSYDAGTVTLPSGEKAYLAQVDFRLRRLPVEASRVFYRTVTRFNDDEAENDFRNIGSARPGKDFVTTEGSFEFNQTTGICSIYVPLLDDQKFEGEESFEIEVYKVEGANLDIQNSTVTIDLRDDEPNVLFEAKTEILSSGETITFPVNIDRDALVPLEVGVFSVSQGEGIALNDATTAPINYYDYEPLAQSILFNPGESSSGFGISFNDGFIPSNSWGKDLQLVTSLSVSDVFELEDSKVIFNEWPLNNVVDNEIVVTQSSLSIASALAVSGNGLVTIGLTQQATNKQAKIRTFYRNGKPFNVGGSFEYSFLKPGVDIELIDLEYSVSSSGDVANLLALLKVNGLVGLSSYGSDDLVVAVLEVDEVNGLQFRNLFQFGTEEADKPIKILKGDRGEILILAESAGQTIDGSLPRIQNKGGVDALVYSLDDNSFEKQWARFVGTKEDDEAIDIDSVSNDIHVLTQIASSQSTSQARIDFLDLNDQGADIKNRKPLVLSFSDQHKVTTTFSGVNGDSLLFSSYGAQDPAKDEFLSSNSEEVYISQFTFNDQDAELASYLSIQSNGNERLLKSELLDDGERAMLAGVTDGKLEGNNALGGQDAFVWGIDLSKAISEAPFQVQFGTPGTDTIIDVAPVLDDKFMVLWSEDHTSGDGSLRYRVSAFAPDGRQLSPSL